MQFHELKDFIQNMILFKKVKRIIGLTVYDLLLAAFIYFVLILFFTPRVFLSPYFIVLVFIGSTTIIFINEYLFSRILKERLNFQWVTTLQNWPKIKKILLGSIFIVILVVGILYRPISESIQEKTILEEAKQQIHVSLYNKSISEASVNRTLVELQKAISKLRKEYIEQPPEYVINLHLFINQDELTQITGLYEWSQGGIVLIPGKSPEIIIPVEKGEDVWNRTMATSTPFHEITHMITFEAMNCLDIHLLPRFLAEGIAIHESIKEPGHFLDKIMYRMWLVLNPTSLQELQNLPNIDLKDRNIEQNDVSTFYKLSSEFILYLEHNFGKEAFWYMLNDIGSGMEFDEAFEKQYRKSFLELYEDFLEYFY